METGLIHVYTGDGKGKTTAAMGLATRALGQGLKVGVFQFLKTGMTGEMVPLVRAGATFLAPQGSGRFTWNMNEAEKAEWCQKQQETFARARDMAPQFNLMVLDEAICAVGEGMLDREALLAFMQNKPEALELVLTGRGADDGLLALADYATEMRCLRHPYNKGQQAREGIEY